MWADYYVEKHTFKTFESTGKNDSFEKEGKNNYFIGLELYFEMYTYANIYSRFVKNTHA